MVNIYISEDKRKLIQMQLKKHGSYMYIGTPHIQSSWTKDNERELQNHLKYIRIKRYKEKMVNYWIIAAIAFVISFFALMGLLGMLMNAGSYILFWAGLAAAGTFALIWYNIIRVLINKSTKVKNIETE